MVCARSWLDDNATRQSTRIALTHIKTRASLVPKRSPATKIAAARAKHSTAMTAFSTLSVLPASKNKVTLSDAMRPPEA